MSCDHVECNERKAAAKETAKNLGVDESFFDVLDEKMGKLIKLIEGSFIPNEDNNGIKISAIPITNYIKDRFSHIELSVLFTSKIIDDVGRKISHDHMMSQISENHNEETEQTVH